MLTNESPFAIKEAYVKLRTSLLFCMTADKERPCSTFAITSAKPSEGKSLTAANIAISYAMLGKARAACRCGYAQADAAASVESAKHCRPV